MKDFWDQRYDTNEFIYGIEPNEFFKDQLASLKPGKIFLPAEGEGRNAVFAANKGWDVYAVDQSEIARKKALKLAEENNVSIHFDTALLQEYSYKHEFFDAAAIIFGHFSLEVRKIVHYNISQSLKPGGVLILEAFHKNQLEYDSGGPKDPEMLYTLRELFLDFPKLKIERATKMKTILSEGNSHKGKAEIVRLVGIKVE